MENRPLSRIRVPDFEHCLAGPLAGMSLANLGTEVIRIDPPGGPRRQDPAFDRLSGGKRTPTLDLKTDRQPIGGSRQLYERGPFDQCASPAERYSGRENLVNPADLFSPASVSLGGQRLKR